MKVSGGEVLGMEEGWVGGLYALHVLRGESGGRISLGVAANSNNLRNREGKKERKKGRDELGAMGISSPNGPQRIKLHKGCMKRLHEMILDASTTSSPLFHQVLQSSPVSE